MIRFAPAFVTSIWFFSWPISALAQGTPCTPAQLSVAQSALKRATIGLDRAIQSIDRGTSADLDRLEKWLGARSSSDAAEVRTVLAKARAFGAGARFECDVRTDAAMGDVYAHVGPNNAFLIGLGAFFFTAPESGSSSKPGVLVHELSHFTLIGGTADPKVYGPAEALVLAQQNPRGARHNAENYEYFVEEIGF